MLTIICIDCATKVKTKATNRIRCENCAELERQKKNREYRKKNVEYHKCATCEASVPEHRTHCGSAIKKGTCLYVHVKLIAYEQRKKPSVNDEKKYKQREVRNHYNDPACGSGYV